MEVKMKNNIFKILMVGFLIIIAGLIVIASDIIVKQGNMNVNDLTVNGKVGIGINPTAQLHTVRNTEGWAGWIENSHTGGADSGLIIRAGDDYSDTALMVQSRTGSNLLRVRANGNVEIGNIQTKTGKIVCVKSDGVLGTCSSIVSSTGGCTCV